MEQTKSEFKQERFVYVFSIITLFNLLVGAMAPGNVIFVSLVASLIFMLFLGRWLEFPWAHTYLERWHDLAYRWCEKKLTGKAPDKYEPQ